MIKYMLKMWGNKYNIIIFINNEIFSQKKSQICFKYAYSQIILFEFIFFKNNF